MVKRLDAEEYKAVKQRIRDHETVRLQMLTLCFTGFAGIFGFSERLAPVTVPILLVLLLLLCGSHLYSAVILQRFATGYMIEHAERANPDLIYERAYYSWSGRTARAPTSRFLAFWKLRGLVLDPLAILLATSVLGSIVYGTKAVDEMVDSRHIAYAVAYVVVLALAHVPIIIILQRCRSGSLEYFVNWWQSYLRPSDEPPVMAQVADHVPCTTPNEPTTAGSTRA